MKITTDSFTRSWRKPAERLLRALTGAVLALSLLAATDARAEGVVVKSARVEASEDGYQLDADFDFQLTSSLQEAVRKGVPLYFVVEFELTRGRWYWLDQKLVQESRDRRVSYAPLTDQYRVSLSGFSQNVSTFEEVRRIVSRVRSWTIAEKGRLKPGEKYEAAVRFRLDTAQLPKPFQLNLLTSKEWSLSSDWYRFTVEVKS